MVKIGSQMGLSDGSAGAGHERGGSGSHAYRSTYRSRRVAVRHDLYECLAIAGDALPVKEGFLMTGHHTGARAARLRERLGQRDMAVLWSLFKLRLLRSDQVQRLHVADGSPQTRLRRSRNLLQRLHDLRLVARLSRRVGGVRAGSSGFVYGLTGLGLAVLEVSGLHGARRRTVWEGKPAFQDHVLAVSELAVQLVEAGRKGRADLLTFEAEPACWCTFSSLGSAALQLKPDAYVRLGIGDFERSAFIEMDMDSERTPAIQRKLHTFVAYWRTGLEQKQNGVFPLVLWLVPNEKRQHTIREVVHRLTNETHQLFAVTLQRDGAAWLTAPAGEEV
jgi:hypothetical protein